MESKKLEIIKIVIVFTIYLMSISCASNGHQDNKQNKEKIDRSLEVSEMDIQKRAKLIDSLSQVITSKNYDEGTEMLYFEYFPNSFSEFDEIFGYSKDEMTGKLKLGPLYENSHIYVNQFFSLNIDREKRIRKIIQISINGKWDADAVNYFQRGMRVMMSEYMVQFCGVLAEENDKDIKSFWKFYFDGYNPINIAPPELLKISSLNERIYNLMCEVASCG